jgi:hypothetical protein
MPSKESKDPVLQWGGTELHLRLFEETLGYLEDSEESEGSYLQASEVLQVPVELLRKAMAHRGEQRRKASLFRGYLNLLLGLSIPLVLVDGFAYLKATHWLSDPRKLPLGVFGLVFVGFMNIVWGASLAFHLGKGKEKSA